MDITLVRGGQPIYYFIISCGRSMASLFDQKLQSLKGVGAKRAQLFEKLGVDSVGALLRYYPRAYEDWSHPFEIDAAPFDRPVCASGLLLFLR